MRFARWCFVAAGLLCLPAARAADNGKGLVERVKKADLVLLGQVIRITEGKLDPDLLKIGEKFRTDVAIVVVVEVLKGDPTLKRVDIGFPGLPKPDQPTLKVNQNGLWFLVKGDQTYYPFKDAGQFLPPSRLGEVRSAVRAAVGLVEPPEKPEDRAARTARLIADLAGNKPDAARRLAAYQLGETGEFSAVPQLIAALDDGAPSVRLAADIALRKITGHRAQVDFRNGTAAVRSRGIESWREWWQANEGRKRQDVLLEAAKSSRRPQADFQHAIEGLAQFNDPALLPVFMTALDSAISRESDALVIAVARYLGRAKHRPAVPKLAGVLDKTWPSEAARAAAATAVGNIVGENFGIGADAINRCAEWWAAHKTTRK